MAVLLSAGAVCAPCAETGFVITAEAASAKLAAPVDFYDRDKTRNTISLAWSEVEGADAYRIYKYDAAKKKYVSYKTVKGTSYTVKGLSAGKAYSFKIAALKKSGGKYKAGKQSEALKIRTLFKYKAGDTVSCDMFSLTLPAGSDYVIETDKGTLSVYDKEAKESGWGGWAFTVEAYETPGDYYGVMERKLGELKTSDGKLYDITAIFASDIQYDYTKYPELMPVSFDKLWNNAEDIFKTIKATDGTYTAGGGMKGKDLYGDVLKKYKKALGENWDEDKLEKEGMNPVYAEIYTLQKCNMLDLIGYAYRDLNGDGIEELLIGEVAEGDEAEVIYDVYTMVDRKPALVVSGWYRNSYYLLEYGLGNSYSDSAAVSGFRTYDLKHNSTEFESYIDFRYDYEKDPDQPYFVAYSDDNYEQLTEEDFNQRASNFGDALHIGYTPFSK